MITKRQYIEYLISTPINYTCSNLAEHLEGMSHDAVSDYLQRDKLTAVGLWERVAPLLNDSEASYLIVDDSVQNKQYSRKIELVKRQYSGAEHGLVRGTGVVNLVHSNGTEFYPVDYRIYAPEAEGKTKNDHFRDMLIHARNSKHLQANSVLFDSWYASADNLKLIERLWTRIHHRSEQAGTAVVAIVLAFCDGSYCLACGYGGNSLSKGKWAAQSTAHKPALSYRVNFR